MNANESLEDANFYFKQKRDQYLVEIRKKKNTDEILRKRMKYSSIPDADNQIEEVVVQLLELPLQQLATYFMENLQMGNSLALGQVAESIRRAVSKNDHPPIDELFETGIVQYIIELLRPEMYHEVKLMQECTWIAVNILSDKNQYVVALVDLQIMPRIVALIDHPDSAVRENVFWMLANLAGDGLAYRDVLLGLGIVNKVDAMLQNNEIPNELIETVVWLISNLCRGKPFPIFEEVYPFVPHICNYLKFYGKDDMEILRNCMWALSYLTFGGEDDIDRIVNNFDIASKLVDMLGYKSTKILVPTLNIIGNLTSGKDEHTELVVEENIIEYLDILLDHNNHRVRKLTLWICSNIAAGTKSQKREFLIYDESRVIKKMVYLAMNEEHQSIKDEAIYALTNLCHKAPQKEIEELTGLGIIEALVENLDKDSDYNVLRAILEALTTILEGADDMDMELSADNPIYILFTSVDGPGALEKLQNIADKGISDAVEKLLKKFT